MQIELGLDTFGDITPDATHAEVIRNVVEEAVLADELGIDFIGLGEHHRPDFAISAPEIVLAAIASRTKRIRLGTSVTVLSTDDPIRVFERFSTLNAVSNGRAEIILGRGSFTESFPLFGFDLDDYETLFEEKVGRLAKALESDRTGSGQRVYPPLGPAGLKVWIGVGGSPESVVRAARYRFPLMLAIIGGDPARFRPYVDLYERSLGQLGSERLEVGVHSPGHVADTDDEAKEQLWPAYREMRNRIGKERGWPPTSRAEFEHEVESGSLYVGSPDTVARKIASTARLLGLSRFDLKYSSGPLRHDWMLHSIALYGCEVIPRVRELL
jgi:probable LLM family oxidoreductase